MAARSRIPDHLLALAPLRRLALTLVPVLALAATAHPAAAQFGGIGKIAGRVANRINPGEALRGGAPITTSLPDARWGVDSLDAFIPAEPKQSLETLARTPNGGFVLRAGYFTFDDQSYCLHAGTHGPGAGDGYLFAPPLGKASDAIITIVRNSVHHPEIAQHDIQALLWAIIARARFEDLSPEYKSTASKLLSAEQLAMLNRSMLDLVPGVGSDALMDRMPPLLRQIAAAEAQLRTMLTTPGTSFEEMERVAVLAGLAPAGLGSHDVPTGRWSLHPDGYYVRYLPVAYSETRVELWVPAGSVAIGREYDPATHIAVPGNTSRQRLIQSGRPHRVAR